MTSKRTRLWDGNTQAAYWDAAQDAQRRAAAWRDGEDAAARLDAIWPGLSDDERAVMDYLLLAGRRSLIGPYEDPVLDALEAKGLLQVPPGVGTLLMRKMETTFRVAPAVWREIETRRGDFLPTDAEAAAARLAAATARLGGRLRDGAESADRA